jgi:NAD(P)H-flavin reductase
LGGCKIESVGVFTARITRVEAETPRNRIVRVGWPAGLRPFAAGQYLSLAEHGQPVRKPYSIASSPAEAARNGELEFLIQVVEGESPGSHLPRLEAGRLLDVEGPGGSFVLPSGLVPGSAVLIGGGTGIAPLRAMVHQLLEEAPASRIAVVQSARTPDELCYAAELRALAAADRIALTETVTRDAPASWRGRRGRVTAADLETLVGDADTWCFVCGPDSLVEDVPRLLAEVGVPAARIRTEHWSDAVVAK